MSKKQDREDNEYLSSPYYCSLCGLGMKDNNFEIKGVILCRNCYLGLDVNDIKRLEGKKNGRI